MPAHQTHRIGTDGAILMLGQDLRPVAEMQQQLVAAQIALEKDYEAQREYDTRLRVLMSATQEGTLFVAASSGEINSASRVFKMALISSLVIVPALTFPWRLCFKTRCTWSYSRSGTPWS